MFQNENEFKKLIEKLKIEHPSNSAHESELRSESLRVFEANSPSMLKRNWKAIFAIKAIRYAAVIIILLIASCLIGILNNRHGTAAKTDTFVEISQNDSGYKDVTPEFLKKFNMVKGLYDDDKITEVVKLLESDDIEIQMIAAEFLGRTSDVKIAQVLERLSIDQPCVELAEKFKKAADSIRKNIDNIK